MFSPELERYLVSKLNDRLHSTEGYPDAIKLVNQISSQEKWLVGGAVFRTLASIIYGSSSVVKDFDFILQDIQVANFPSDARVTTNRYGNPKVRFNGVTIDLCLLSEVEHIKHLRLQPNVNNYLAGVPLTIQSIVYSLATARLIGDIGKNALLTKTVAINNHTQALSLPISPLDLVKEKASSLGFMPLDNIVRNGD